MDESFLLFRRRPSSVRIFRILTFFSSFFVFLFSLLMRENEIFIFLFHSHSIERKKKTSNLCNFFPKHAPYHSQLKPKGETQYSREMRYHTHIFPFKRYLHCSQAPPLNTQPKMSHEEEVTQNIFIPRSLTSNSSRLCVA
jgi:hypothetical protein